ncbi:unnamed protein product [Bursaphelenchus xylophilus]|uniref:protein disulfide-isomerase n=1 Tax=Bursaphelenchus xylophilus TaxID=6326 RepID=A0A1I7S4M0_BURXY|nr:unnamed protein product [Bursaphelenchus xylophilus]CAG9117231.1 unnamed protein product [Bursaphelenchus xylophilus]
MDAAFLAFCHFELQQKHFLWFSKISNGTLETSWCCPSVVASVFSDLRAGRLGVDQPWYAMILRFGLAFACVVATVNGAKDSDVCGYCKFMVETFKAGLKKTENQHFAGGNTDWEERKLGKFKTSETRFIEIMEYVCHKDHLENAEEFSDLKDLRFKCNHLAEDTEEILEKWFFKGQDSEIFKYVCIDEAKKCCPEGHYGANCSPCPGALKGLTCFKKGKCDGEGTRLGTGKCECKSGYAGVRCSTCAAHFYEVSKTDDSIECAACFDGCASSCKGPTSLDCTACRTGYRMVEKEGCKDVDECETDGEKLCDKENEICVNTPGSYNCECKNGYKRDYDTDECVLDVNDPDLKDEL